MANGTELDTSLCDISPLSSNLTRHPSKESAVWLRLRAEVKDREADRWGGERKVLPHQLLAWKVVTFREMEADERRLNNQHTHTHKHMHDLVSSWVTNGSDDDSLFSLEGVKVQSIDNTITSWLTEWVTMCWQCVPVRKCPNADTEVASLWTYSKAQYFGQLESNYTPKMALW